MFKPVRTDQRDWPLPAHRRRTRGGMDAATELAWTYLQRVPRGWAGKGPAASAQILRSAPEFPHASKRHDFICCNRLACADPGQSKARCLTAPGSWSVVW
ncbi:hypothetical protein FMO13_10775 [Xanthomonas phaseoli pv. dieffenbachiae]